MDIVIHIFPIWVIGGIVHPDSIVVEWHHVTSSDEWEGAKRTCATSRSQHLIGNLSLTELCPSSAMATSNVQNGYFVRGLCCVQDEASLVLTHRRHVTSPKAKLCCFKPPRVRGLFYYCRWPSLFLLIQQLQEKRQTRKHCYGNVDSEVGQLLEWT